jgi:hypothetical protein
MRIGAQFCQGNFPAQCKEAGPRPVRTQPKKDIYETFINESFVPEKKMIKMQINVSYLT